MRARAGGPGGPAHLLLVRRGLLAGVVAEDGAADAQQLAQLLGPLHPRQQLRALLVALARVAAAAAGRGAAGRGKPGGGARDEGAGGPRGIAGGGRRGAAADRVRLEGLLDGEATAELARVGLGHRQGNDGWVFDWAECGAFGLGLGH